MAPIRWSNVRIHLFSVVFVLLFLAVTTRAYLLQVHSGDKLRQRAEQQQQQMIPLTPQRGTIYDANGHELAVSLEVDSVYVHPAQLEDAAAAAKALAKVLDLPLREVREKLRSGKGFVWLKRRVTPQESAEVTQLKLAGVNTTKEHKRYYPGSHLGAQVLGFTGIDPTGLEGLELQYDREVLGQGGYLLTRRDALGRRLASDSGIVRSGSRGNSLHLTLDRNLQYIAEKELAESIRQTGARTGSIVMLEATTGRVLAMASQPDFNPNALERHKPFQWRNRAVADSYEPGSTLKVFLMAAALQEKLVSPQQRIFCEKGKYSVGGHTIHDAKPYDRLTVTEVLKLSSNIGSAKIGQLLGRDRLHHYLTEFGFGSRTGVDLPGEVPGLIRAPKDWFEIDLAAISFGQGLSVTPLQLASATAAIANDGVLMQPYLVERVTDSDGRLVQQCSPRELRRVVSVETARQLREMMAAVTEPDGTGSRAAVTGFRVGGKTGTAQKVDPVTGGYSVDKRTASFVGLVPAERPEIVIAVVIDEPQDSRYGGVIAAPVFANVASQALTYRQVQPTVAVAAQALPPVAPPTDLPAFQVAAPAAPLSAGERRMPDFRGMSYRQVLRAMQQTGLNIRLTGSGRVVAQSPAAEAPVAFGNEIWVRFEPADAAVGKGARL